MDRINVVILSEETQYKVKIKNKIVSEDIAIVGYSDFKEESKLKIEGYFPDVLICALDRNDIDDAFYNFVGGIKETTTGCAVVIVTDNVNVDLVNTAAKLGIRQVLDFEIEPQEFTNKIIEVNELEQKLLGQLKIERRVRSKVYAFYGTKGGCGTSSIAANVAISLANKGKKVIVLDFDLQHGDLNLMFDLDPKDTIVELARDPEGISIEKVNTSVALHPAGFSVLCAPKSPEYGDYVEADHIRKIIENVRPYFEYIIIDLGCNYADTTLTALEVCDEIELIANLNISSLKGMKDILNVLQNLRVSEKANFIVNKNRSSLIKIADFENLMQKKVYATIVADRNACINALNSGSPVISSAPRCATSKDINKFVDILIEDKSNVSK